jgi:hypothetical protein
MELTLKTRDNFNMVAFITFYGGVSLIAFFQGVFKATHLWRWACDVHFKEVIYNDEKAKVGAK